MHRHSLHEVRPEAFNYVWDNAIPPALEVDSGAEVELHVRDAGDEQIGRDSGAEAVTALDFSHVNPVSGPVFVKDAKPVDVLALTSVHEGFPNVVVEAMASGAVAVTTDVGGCRELVTHQETGLLVPSRAPAAVAAAALRVLRDAPFARQLAIAARRRVESELRVERMAERTTAAYLDLLRAQRPPAAVAAA